MNSRGVNACFARDLSEPSLGVVGEAALQLWAVPLVPPPPALAATLPHYEIERAMQYRNPDDRDRCIVGRLALRALLARTSGQPVQRIRIARGPHGAPLPRDTGWRCSLSHAGRWILVGLCPDFAVGVDLEPLREIPDLLTIAAHHFHPAEQATLGSATPERRSMDFLRMWVRKEAVAKATSLGLCQPLNDWHVLHEGCADPQPGPIVVTDRAARRWMVFDLDVDTSCVAAVATLGRVNKIRVRVASLSRLVAEGG